ncbi:hypothetical protein CY34DRAFT_602345 [Suillus luteus UH-Slu-Lm8-n1]|uniref:Uncharacterized protein n=1 Tax=Suillus luteus UH-Slu-Lm8-n1 TaxID=930992 RepID=A0A0D0B436_9AGAM|nr:hypothetical protein CY34DRAFT_602345 [Suillus luteus UH-Slu-Lm8-n1]
MASVCGMNKDCSHPELISQTSAVCQHECLPQKLDAHQVYSSIKRVPFTFLTIFLFGCSRVPSFCTSVPFLSCNLRMNAKY